jgi:uncharacterized membrane protein
VALSDKEKQVLEELERQLLGGKPKAKKEPELKPVAYARLLVLGSIMVLAGLGIMIYATSIHQTWLGVVAFILMLAGLYFVSQNWSSRALKAGRPKAKPAREDSKSYFEKLWDERNKG